MNNQRRTEIKRLKNSLLEDKKTLEKIINEESISFDSMPENLQGSDRGMESEDAIDAMEEALESLETVIEKVGEII